VKTYSLTHLSDESLRRELSAAAANEKQATAELVAHIAEFDERKLYLPAAYPNMFAYCVGELGLSEDATAKRLQVARVSRRCPDVLEALSQGRVHLSGLVLLAPHLTPDTADELLAAATRKSKADIERLLAERHPRPDVPASAEPIPSGPVSPCADSHAPGHVEATLPIATGGSPGNSNPRGRVSPLSAEAFAVQFTRSREADERFRLAQDLLGHQVGPNDIAEVYDLAMKELVKKLERTRRAATSRPAHARRSAAGSRHVPAHVKRAVWQRDGGRCTYVSESGRRCEARRGLEYDHVKEFARGGEATVDGIRLRCRGHNQFTAERTFGAGFMKQKRETAAAARAMKDRAARVRVAGRAVEAHLPDGSDNDVFLALQTLGYRAAESRRALAQCADMPGASAEEKLRRALTYFPQRCHRSSGATLLT
jgi:5-methylcytosine-specific restriction endonuclease McrA